eukprot:31197-Pelagococcus_subviridis.AAC.23
MSSKHCSSMIAGRVTERLSSAPSAPFSTAILQNSGKYFAFASDSPIIGARSHAFASAASISSNGVSNIDPNMHDWPPSSPAPASSSPSSPFSILYALIASSTVLCTLRPNEPLSASPTTDPYDVIFIATSSRRTKRYASCIGRRDAIFSHGAARTKSAAAPNNDAPKAGVNPSTDSIKPGKCCVPHSWFAGAMFGSICPRMMSFTSCGGTGANETSDTPIAFNPSRHPSTYSHAVSAAHFDSSPRCKLAVVVSANRIVFGRAGFRRSPAFDVFMSRGFVMQRRKNRKTVSAVGFSLTTFPPDASSGVSPGSHARNAPSSVDTTSMRYGRTGCSSSPGIHARSLWT